MVYQGATGLYHSVFTFFLIHSHNTINSELIEYANCIRLFILSNTLLINTTVLNISTSDTSFPNFTLKNTIISPSHSSTNLDLVFDDKYHLRITYYPLQNRPNYISCELKKYGLHFPETLRQL